MLRVRRRDAPAVPPGAPDVPALEALRLSTELGRYREAHRRADALYGGVLSEEGEEGPDRTPGPARIDARPFLLRVAAGTPLLMLNEAHHVPQHRAFAHTLLPGLRELGFQYLAAEAVFDTEEALNRRGYPLREVEGYLREPVFGDLIRTALRLGFRVVPYEAATAEDRELAQARNLARRIPFRDPGTKTLVLAGHGHVDKAGEVAGRPTMARRLAELTGLGPFVAEQTVMTEHSARRYEHPLYRRLADPGLGGPTVFEREEGQGWSLEPARWDVTIFHPRSRYRRGRPTWLELGGVRRPIDVPEGFPDSERPCLVRARFARESPGAVPVDQVECCPGQGLPPLLLPEGEMGIEAVSAAGELLARGTVTVSDSDARLRVTEALAGRPSPEETGAVPG